MIFLITPTEGKSFRHSEKPLTYQAQIFELREKMQHTRIQSMVPKAQTRKRNEKRFKLQLTIWFKSQSVLSCNVALTFTLKCNVHTRCTRSCLVYRYRRYKVPITRN